MKSLALMPLLLAAAPAPPSAPPVLSPPEIVDAAPMADWVAIAPEDLLVMELAAPAQGPGQASAKGRPRRVIIQLMPPPFSQGWVGNIRKLALARWWDGLSVNRVQDNYVVQWGDADGENPKKAKALPPLLRKVSEREYSHEPEKYEFPEIALTLIANDYIPSDCGVSARNTLDCDDYDPPHTDKGYAHREGFHFGWPYASDLKRVWPVHCYAAVGVGRDLPPDTGTGAELYTVIGHAPRHLDRNIAVVGRVIEGIEHLSSLPRGTGALGFYETAEERVPILSIRLGSEAKDLPRFEYLSTESGSFAKYAEARANRRDAFFVRPAGGADICNIPVPVRRVK